MSTPGRNKKGIKRAASPASGVQTPKKKSLTSPVVASALDIEGGSSNTCSPTPVDSVNERVLVFKDPNFVHSTKEAASTKKTRVWKSLKQITAAERGMPWRADVATYGTIDAPPSFKPAKKYSDLTGLQAKYTCPLTKIRYATPDEFSRIRLLPSDIVSGYLALRRANTPVP